MGISQTFAERLKSLRGKLSQAAFAGLLGIANPPTYQRYEKGRVPDPDMLCKIANQFGVTVDWLLGRGEEEKKPGIVREAGAEYGRPLNISELVSQLSKITGVSEEEIRRTISELIRRGS